MKKKYNNLKMVAKKYKMRFHTFILKPHSYKIHYYNIHIPTIPYKQRWIREKKKNISTGNVAHNRENERIRELKNNMMLLIMMRLDDGIWFFWILKNKNYNFSTIKYHTGDMQRLHRELDFFECGRVLSKNINF